MGWSLIYGILRKAINNLVYHKDRSVTISKKPDTMTLIIGIVLVILLVFSLVLYILEPYKQMQRKFLFFSEETGSLSGEIRSVPFSKNRERNITAYIKELMLGPAGLRLQGIFPRGTRMNQIKLVEDVLYIDFSREMVFNLDNHPFPPVEIKNMVVDNLSVNFPGLEKVVITVNGLEPDFEIKE
jgi:hypothetical protein